MDRCNGQSAMRARDAGVAVLALATLAYACGGKSASRQSVETSDTGGAGGVSGTGALAGSSSGGAAHGSAGGGAGTDAGVSGGMAGSNDGMGGSGARQTGGGSGGTMPRAGATFIPPGGGSAGAGDACSVNTLLKAVGNLVGVTGCSEASATLGPDEQLSSRRGAIVLDEDGRVVDITGRSGDAKQLWLDRLADQRWPCLADKTIGYQCASPD